MTIVYLLGLKTELVNTDMININFPREQRGVEVDWLTLAASANIGKDGDADQLTVFGIK